MKFSSIFATAIVITTAAGSTAHAQDYNGRVSVGVSSLGASAEASYKVQEQFALRGVAAGLVELSPTIEFDGVDYNTSVSPFGIGAMLDIYPIQNRGLRFSMGVLYSELNASGGTTASAANPIQVGSVTLNSGETVTAGLEFENNIQPVLSLGWDQPIGNSRFVISAEVGAAYTGGLTPTVEASGGIIPTLVGFGADVDAEVQSIANDLPDIPVYPFASVKIGLQF